MPISLRVLLLLILANCIMSNKAQDRAFVQKQKALERELLPFELDNENAKETVLDWLVALRLFQREEADSLKQVAVLFKDELESENDKGVFHYVLGMSASRATEYEKAQKEFVKAGTHFNKAGKEVEQLYVATQVANLVYYTKQVEIAYGEYKKLLSHPKCPAQLQMTLNHNCGAVLMELRQVVIDTKTRYFQDKENLITTHLDRSLLLADSLGSDFSKASTYSIYVNVEMSRNNLQRAQQMIDSTKAIARRANDMSRLAFIRIKEGQLLNKLGKFKAARDTSKLAVDYFERIGNWDQMIHAASLLYNLHYEQEQYKDAADVGLKLYETYRDFLDTSTTNSISKYREEFEAEKRELTIREQQTQLEKGRLELSARNRTILALSLGVILIAALAWIIMQRNKRKAERERARLLLEKKQEGIRAVLHAQEEERQRIAKDLHDGIVQQLGGLKLGLQKNITPGQEGDRLLTLLDDSTKQLRDLSHRMMPKALKELGLIPALQDMLSNSLGNATIKYDLEHHGMNTRIPEHVEITLYRIAQELVNNVIKHSAARTVCMQLIKLGGNVILIVEDDGKGFDLSRTGDGIGLMNINSRLDTVDGSVNFDASPEGGTLATVRIPLSQ